MKKTTLIIRDECNVKFTDLDPMTRRKVADKLAFFIPSARHMPAFKLGRWDGKVKFSDAAGRTYINCLDVALPVIYEQGYEVEIDDQREIHNFEFNKIDETFLSDTVWPEGHVAAGDPIVLRDYQVDAVNRYLESLHGVQEISTSAGKTIITATLSKITEKYGRSIVIVPNKDLVTQTAEDYRNLGLDVGLFYGDQKDYDKTHTICTWQSIDSLIKKSKRKEAEIDIDRFLEGVVCVMVDETHAAKADKLKDMLTGPMSHIPIRWGLTGTIPKEDFNFMSIKVCLGDIIGRLRAKDLQDKGVISNIHIHVKQFKDHGEFDSYQSELKWLVTNKTRMKHISDYISKLSESGNTLVLVDRVACGELLTEFIEDSVFVNGSVKSKDRKEEYDTFKDEDNKVLVATFGVASTGINLPRIFNLVMIEPGKSFVRVIQSIGRGLRKAQDKDFINVYDITSTCKYSKRHLTKRKAFYKDSEYPFKVEKIDY